MLTEYGSATRAFTNPFATGTAERHRCCLVHSKESSNALSESSRCRQLRRRQLGGIFRLPALFAEVVTHAGRPKQRWLFEEGICHPPTLVTVCRRRKSFARPRLDLCSTSVNNFEVLCKKKCQFSCCIGVSSVIFFLRKT